MDSINTSSETIKLINNLNPQIFKFEDDFLAESINYETIEDETLKKLTSLNQNKYYRIVRCFIYDDHDSYCVKLLDEFILLHIVFKTIIDTKFMDAFCEKKLNSNSHYADIHYQYIFHQRKIISNKLLYINLIPSKY